VNWRNRGTCGPQDADRLFFAPDGEGIGARRRRETRAKAVCDRCPVIRICRQWSLDTRQEYGVYGGLSERERREILHPQPLAPVIEIQRTSKHCPRCGTDKPVSEFTGAKSRADGLSSYCRPCSNAHKRERRKAAAA
jgi:WhiB family redox-sensing transcriptional regulator